MCVKPCSTCRALSARTSDEADFHFTTTWTMVQAGKEGGHAMVSRLQSKAIAPLCHSLLSLQPDSLIMGSDLPTWDGTFTPVAKTFT